MIFVIFILGLVGFCISLYTFCLEKKVKQDANYKPVCDLSDRISCSKPMKSSYANLFFFSNAFVGIVFYVLILLLAYFDALMLLRVVVIGGCLVSCVLAYLLYFKIKSLCLLCTSLYAINFLLLYFSLWG